MTLFFGIVFCSVMTFTAIVFRMTRNMIADVKRKILFFFFQVLHLFVLFFLQQLQLNADLHKQDIFFSSVMTSCDAPPSVPCLNWLLFGQPDGTGGRCVCPILRSHTQLVVNLQLRMGNRRNNTNTISLVTAANVPHLCPIPERSLPQEAESLFYQFSRLVGWVDSDKEESSDNLHFWEGYLPYSTLFQLIIGIVEHSIIAFPRHHQEGFLLVPNI